MRFRALFLFLGILSLASSVTAQESQDWTAFVSGQSTPGAMSAFADAFHAKDALENQGVTISALVRDEPALTVTTMLTRSFGARQVILFHAGQVDGERLVSVDGSNSLTDMLTQLAENGTERVLVLVENCSSLGEASTALLRQPDIPAGLAVDVIASTLTPACPNPEERLTERLKTIGSGDLLVSLQGLPRLGTALASVDLPGLQSTETMESADLADGPLLLPVETPPPVEAIEQQARSGSTGSQITTDEAEPLLIFASLPQAQLVAQPWSAALPKPSIIVGRIGPADAAAEEDSEGSEISWSDLATRRTLRAENAALFETLVETGAFDPSEEELVVALQTELTRMECYNRGIDGDWGPGSISGVRRYFETIDEAVPSTEPQIELFRTFVRRDDVICPPVARPAATARATTPRRTGTTRTRATQQQRTRTTQQARPTQTQTRTRTTTRSNSSSGRVGIGIGIGIGLR